ncbi:helix-turn-helix domain-containing protein [Streptomyces sp. NPDC001393]
MTACVRAINEERELAHVLSLIARHACELLGLRQCAVYVLDESAGTFHIGGSHGLTERYVATANAHPIRLDEATEDTGPPTARAALIRRPVVVPDAFVEPGLERWRESMRKEGLRMMVVAPLPGADGAPMGTLTGYVDSVRSIEDDDLDQLTLLSDHAAAAIVAARRRDRERLALAALRETNAASQVQKEALARLSDVQHTLTGLVLEDAGLHRIAATLGAALDADVYLDDEQGQPIVSSTRAGLRTVPAPFRGIAEVDDETIAAAMASGRATTTGERRYLLVPVPRVGRTQIRMWLRPRGAGELDEHTVRAVEGCAALIAVERSRLEVQAHAEARLVNDLLADLLSPASMAYPESVVARARALGHDPTSCHTPIIVLPFATEAADAETGVADLAASLVAMVRGMRPRPVVGTVGQAAVVLVPAGERSDATETVLRYAREPGQGQFRWVVGTTAPTLVDVRTPLDVALRAANLLTADSPRVVHIAGFGVPGLLLEAGTSERMLRFAEDTLGPIIGDDQAKEGGLLTTLTEWFRCDMSARDTARRLYVHPNTVGYRLRRISELTGLRLTNPGDLMTLRLALDVFVLRGRLG